MGKMIIDQEYNNLQKNIARMKLVNSLLTKSLGATLYCLCTQD